MKCTIITAGHFNTATWSGGTTTELFIFPATANYKLRNFQFRISTATVETDHSEFTPLPGISRKLMVLAGETILSHKGHYSRQLNKFDVDEFEGDWKTSSIGKCTDFNLMTTGKTSGELTGIIVKKEHLVNQAITVNRDWLFLYLYSGKVGINIKGEIASLQTGDFLIVNKPSKINFEIRGIENSELVFSAVTL